MKKAISIALILLMFLLLSTAAFAAGSQIVIFCTIFNILIAVACFRCI